MSSSELAHSKCSFPFLPPPDFQNMQLKVGSALDSNRPSLSYSPILLEPSHLWMFSFLFLVPPLSVLLRSKKEVRPRSPLLSCCLSQPLLPPGRFLYTTLSQLLWPCMPTNILQCNPSWLPDPTLFSLSLLRPLPVPRFTCGLTTWINHLPASNSDDEERSGLIKTVFPFKICVTGLGFLIQGGGINRKIAEWLHVAFRFLIRHFGGCCCFHPWCKEHVYSLNS